MEKIILSILIFIILASVIAPYEKHHKKESTDIILGDKSGKKNAINITTQSNKKVKINKPFLQISIDNKAELKEPKQLSKDDISKRFSKVISAQPLELFSTNIFFKKGIELYDDYLIKIFQIKNEIKRRQPCEVDIVGYSDSKGSAKKNQLLSKKRALLIKKLLEATKVKIKHINILAYGEKNQLIKTGDEVSQKKNRRVEVIVR